MVPNAIFYNFGYGGNGNNKSGLIIQSVQEYIVSWNSLSIIFLEISYCEIFSMLDYLGKLWSNDYSFMKLKFVTRFFMMHIYWENYLIKNSLILDKVIWIRRDSSSPSLPYIPLSFISLFANLSSILYLPLHFVPLL